MPGYHSPYGWRWECLTHPLVRCLRNGELLWQTPSSLPLRNERWAQSYWSLSDQRQRSLSWPSLNPLRERERQREGVGGGLKQIRKNFCAIFFLSLTIVSCQIVYNPSEILVNSKCRQFNNLVSTFLTERLSLSFTLSHTHNWLLCCYWPFIRLLP